MQKADYYEALTWHALEQIYGADKVRYEPAREMHTCGDRCRFAFRCAKPQAHARLIHTIPDFVVDNQPPLFVQVFHADSRETSHAKFWRTVSEIAELKCFVPGCRCLCVIFESACSRGQYAGAGWYPEFLKALHYLADRVVFCEVPALESDSRLLGKRLSDHSGTAAVHREIAKNLGVFPMVNRLAAHIRTARHPSPAVRSAVHRMWEKERERCADVPPFQPREHSGERLRNALLQTVLVMLLFDWDASLALDRIGALTRASRERFPDRDRIVDWMCRITIRRRGEKFHFLAENAGQPIGQPVQCEPSDDLRWLIRSLARGEIPSSRSVLEVGLTSIAAKFAASRQTRDVIASLRSALMQAPDRIDGSPTAWVAAFERVPADLPYNPVAEILIEAIGLGTYPLIRAYNQRYSESPINRLMLRNLYGNRRKPVQRAIIRRLVRVLPDSVNWASVHTAYLLRKANRIVGPQSALNPLEILARAIIAERPLPDGISLVEHGVLPTLAADLVASRQLGTWRVALAFQTAEEIIPLFISAMRDPQDCAHKVREFAGHLRLARHRWDGKRLRSTRVRRGIAVLEGGYSEDDKRALFLAGFHIASLDTLLETVGACGVASSQERRPSRQR